MYTSKMWRNKKMIFVVCLFIAGLLYSFRWQNTGDGTNTAETRKVLEHYEDPGRSASNRLILHHTAKEPRVAPISQLSQSQSGQSVDLGRSRAEYHMERSFGQTYYKWNDLATDGWKTLPLKRLKNGSLVSRLTREEAKKAMIYTRVPKTGSRFLLDLIRSAAQRNKFHMIYSVVYNHSGVVQDRFVQDVGRIRPPFFLARQLFFIDFTEFKMAQPIFFGMIRDPVDRLVSSFNFNRFGDGTRNKWYKMFRGNKTLTLDDCIMNNATECSVEGASVSIRYFCGHGRRCRQPSDWSFRRAMDNVKRHYSVVGLMEDYEDTLKVLEKRLPDFFKGAPRLYAHAARQIKTASKKKYTPSLEAEEVLRKRLHLEYKFYNFVKSRLDALKKKLKI